MAQKLSLDKVVAELVELDQSSLPGAKETVGRAGALKANLKERLVDGEAFPEKSKYFARLKGKDDKEKDGKEKSGRASYKRVIEEFQREHPEYKDELKSLTDDDKKAHPTYKVEYGVKQLELFQKN